MAKKNSVEIGCPGFILMNGFVAAVKSE